MVNVDTKKNLPTKMLKLYELVAQVILTHIKEICDLKQEVHELKTKLKDMAKHMEANHNNMRKTEEYLIVESSKVLYQCEECEYKC